MLHSQGSYARCTLTALCLRLQRNQLKGLKSQSPVPLDECQTDPQDFEDINIVQVDKDRTHKPDPAIALFNVLILDSRLTRHSGVGGNI